jgi:SAM-dependent methyltransferase
MFRTLIDLPFDAVMHARAALLCRRLAPWLPAGDAILDIGSGTGHNGHRLRRLGRTVVESDIVDMHTCGPGPARIEDGRLPFGDDAFDWATMLYILHYVERPEAILAEARRTVRKGLIVLQSTCEGSAGRSVLRMREQAEGDWAFRFARWCGYVGRIPNPLRVRGLFDRGRLEQAFRNAGWRWELIASSRLPAVCVRRDLYRLTPDPERAP